jgi:hypothetical protein
MDIFYYYLAIKNTVNDDGMPIKKGTRIYYVFTYTSEKQPPVNMFGFDNWQTHIETRISEDCILKHIDCYEKNETTNF